MVMKCPFCGREIPPSQHNGWERQEMLEYHIGAANTALVAPGTTWTRREPARPANVESDVTVPLLQALACGVFVGMIGVGVSLALDWPWWVGPAALSGGTAVAWFTLLGDHRRLLWHVEQIVGTDLDGDGQIGRPTSHIQVEITDREARQMRLVDLPVSDDVLRSVAMAVIRGRSFSRRAMAGIISESDFNKLQGAMIEGGLARYKGNSPNAGIELTPAGKAVFSHYL